jgi:hypothetical protein
MNELGEKPTPKVGQASWVYLTKYKWLTRDQNVGTRGTVNFDFNSVSDWTKLDFLPVNLIIIILISFIRHSLVTTGYLLYLFCLKCYTKYLSKWRKERDIKKSARQLLWVMDHCLT